MRIYRKRYVMSITGNFFVERPDGMLDPMPGYRANVVFEEAQELARKRARSGDNSPVNFMFGDVAITVTPISDLDQLYETWKRDYRWSHPDSRLPKS